MDRNRKRRKYRFSEKKNWLINSLVLLLAALSFLSTNAQQDTVWSEDFSSYPNGTQQAPPKWTTQWSDSDDGSNNLRPGQSYWGVENGRFRVNDIEGPLETCFNYWWSEPIDISAYINVTASVFLTGGGGLECTGSGFDEIRTSFRIDGGPWEELCKGGYICGANGIPITAQQANLAGNTLEIQIQLGNKANPENYYFDNILVVGDTADAPIPGTDSIITICEGDSVLIDGQYESQKGRYFITYQDSSGCDSISVIGLLIDSTKTTSVSTIICEGDSVFLEDSFRKTSGLYTDSLQTAAFGCDSIVYTNLTVLSSGGDTTVIEICDTDSVLINNTFQSTPGFYNDTITRHGCDSVSIINLRVNPTHQVFQQFSICDDDSVLVNGRYLKNTGVFFDFLTSSKGCDSSVITQLTVHPRYDFSIIDSICKGDSIFLEGSYRKTGGVYRDTFSTAHGCDSLVTTDLFIIQPVQAPTQETICTGDSILLGNIYRKTTGIYRDTITSLRTGCDSIRFVQLSVIPPPLTEIDAVVCNNDSINIEGTFIDSAGTYEFIFNLPGNVCDSIVRYNVIESGSIDSVTLQLCQGDSTFLEGQWRKTTGFYSDTLPSSQGCDSITVTELVVSPILYNESNSSICAGDSILMFGEYRYTTGVYSDTLISSFGCDSVLTDTLIVFPEYEQNQTAIICANDSFLFASTYYKTSGTYFDTLQTNSGCDSVIKLDLTVNPSFKNFNSHSICSGDSILLAGKFRKTAGIYRDTFQTKDGCDSIFIDTLFINLSYFNNTSVAICSPDSFLFQGSYYKVSGIYNDTLQTSKGCDSILALSLTVEQPFTEQFDYSICEGDSIKIYNIWRSSAGTYNDTLQASNGCDSILESQLTVYQNKQVNQTFSICTGDTIIIVGTPRFTSGIYHDTLSSSEGCDSIIISALHVEPEVITNETREACQGDSTYVNGIAFGSDTILTESYLLPSGCDSIHETELIFYEINAAFRFDIISDHSISFTDLSNGAVNYKWHFNNIDSSNQVNPTYEYSEAGNHPVTLIVQNSYGCRDTVTKEILIPEINQPEVIVPNIFTPNGDGINDYFQLNYKNTFNFQIKIFNRWGNLVFESRDPGFKWEGPSKQTESSGGTFYYVISGDKNMKGSITMAK